MSGSKATYMCMACGLPFLARTADRARGWARFCSKSCKAVRQEQRTGQHAAYKNRKNHDYENDEFEGGECFPSHADGEVQ